MKGGVKVTLWLKIGLYGIAAAVAVAVLSAAIRTGKPIRRLGASCTQGLCALGLVDVLGTFTGASLGFSWFTVGVCSVLGIPGVISILLLRLLLII